MKTGQRFKDLVDKIEKINSNIALINHLMPENEIEQIELDNVCHESIWKHNTVDLVIYLMDACYDHGYKKAICDGNSNVMFNK